MLINFFHYFLALFFFFCFLCRTVFFLFSFPHHTYAVVKSILLVWFLLSIQIYIRIQKIFFFSLTLFSELFLFSVSPFHYSSLLSNFASLYYTVFPHYNSRSTCTTFPLFLFLTRPVHLSSL